MGADDEDQSAIPEEVDQRVDEDPEARFARFGVDVERDGVEILAEPCSVERGMEAQDCHLGGRCLDLPSNLGLQASHQGEETGDHLLRLGRTGGVERLGMKKGLS